MNLLKITTIALTTALGASAFADNYTATSQFLHQTNKATFELTPQVGAGSINYKYKNNGTNTLDSTTDKYLNVNVMGEYGISDMVSVGAIVGYQKENFANSGANGNSVDNTHGDGMLDPQIFMNGRYDTGGGLLRYGLIGRFSPAKANISSSSVNEYSGGTTITPYVGYEYIFGTSTVGARVSYDLIQTDRSVSSQGQTIKVKDGNEMTATVFYEMNYKPVLIGVDVGLLNYKATTVDGQSFNNNYSTGRADIYAVYDMGDNLSLLPTIGFNTPNSGSQAGRIVSPGANSSGGVAGDVALRLTF